jgi:hypothetical protein
LPVIGTTGAPAKPTTRWIARNDLQNAMLIAHRKRLFHNLRNLTRLKGLRTPPPRTKTR